MEFAANTQLVVGFFRSISRASREFGPDSNRYTVLPVVSSKGEAHLWTSEQQFPQDSLAKSRIP